MIILFNINNKEVLSQVDNERIIAVSMNKENNEKGEQENWGQVMVITNGWRYR